VKTLGIAVCFAAGAVVSRWLLHALSPAFAVDLAQPLVVATNWGHHGALTWIVLAATIAAAFVPYVQLLRAPPPLAKTFAAAMFALIAGWFWLPLFSSDVYAYAAYGEMARLGLDPYVHHVAVRDALIDAADWQWRPAPVPICVYGPAFVMLARTIVAGLHGLGIVAVLDGFRFVSCAALLLCGYAAHSIAGTRAAAFIMCNPVAIFAAIEGHNDTIMVAVVLAGVLVMRRAPGIGAALVALAATVKLPALAASAAIAFDAALTRRNAAAIVWGTAIAWMLVLGGSWALIEGARSNLAPHGHYLPLASVQALGIPIAAIAFAAVLFRARTARAGIDRWCVIALAAWIAIPSPYPWYALWLLAISAFASDRRIVAAALAIACAAVFRYLPDAVAIPSSLESIALGVIALAAFAPLPTTSSRASSRA